MAIFHIMNSRYALIYVPQLSFSVYNNTAMNMLNSYPTFVQENLHCSLMKSLCFTIKYLIKFWPCFFLSKTKLSQIFHYSIPNMEN